MKNEGRMANGTIRIQKSALKLAPSRSDQRGRRSGGVEVACEGNEDVCLRNDTLNGHQLENLNARLGGVKIGNEHKSTRITEIETATLTHIEVCRR